MASEPTILAFDTSAAHCAAALLCAGTVTARREEMGRGQAERLMGLLEELLAEAGIGWPDLDAVGVGVGPGNFTGIRIAVAAARGLALGLGVPAIGVSTLEAQALDAPRPCWSVVDARRGAVYAQRFGDGPEGAPRLLPDGARLPDPAPLAPVQPDALAPAIARIAAARLASGAPLDRPAPLYIRTADAAPPRDPAPVILDD